MTRLEWGLTRMRTYEIGVDQGVLYPSAGLAVAWPGLIRVDEIHANQDVEDEYFEGRKFATTVSKSEFQAKLSAFSTPKEFYPAEGYLALGRGLYATHQMRDRFGFSYRSQVGNAIEGIEYGYRIHIIYNAIAIPSVITRSTTSTSAEPTVREWTLKTIPFYKLEYAWFTSPDNSELVPRGTVHRPVSHLTVDSRSVSPQALTYLEQVLYGTDITEPELPTPTELIEIIR